MSFSRFFMDTYLNDRDRRRLSDFTRFLSVFLGRDKCWDWPRPVTEDGYGHFFLNGKMNPAHRIIYTLAGIDIPEGMVIDHTCRNRRCFNPQHLRIVTRRTNTLENSMSPSAKARFKTHCKHGHPLSGDNVILYQRKNKEYPERRCVTCYRRRANETTKRRRVKQRAEREKAGNPMRRLPLTEDEVNWAKGKIGEMTHAEIAKVLNCNKSVISYIRNNKHCLQLKKEKETER